MKKLVKNGYLLTMEKDANGSLQQPFLGDILIENIDCFSAELHRLRQLLQEDNRAGLQEMFRKSSARRAEFDAGHKLSN